MLSTPKSKEPVFLPAITQDSSPPRVEIVAPKEKEATGSFEFRAAVHDATGIEKVTFLVIPDDAPVIELVGTVVEPGLYRAEWGGRTLTPGKYGLLVTALDSTGNTKE